MFLHFAEEEMITTLFICLEYTANFEKLKFKAKTKCSHICVKYSNV